jgi:FkbM family methyltransferase
MSVFLPSLKKNGYLDQIHITLCIVGSRKLKEFGQIYNIYASQGWGLLAPNLTVYGFDADEEACNDMNNELESQSINWTEKHFPYALWDTSGKATLYITNYQACSSLYHPNLAYINRFGGDANIMYKVISTVEVQTTTLDDVLIASKDHFKEIDYLQIDVQGGELNVLKGAITSLKNVLAVVAEVEFMQVYKNQPLFSDVDVYLKEQGFSLFDLVGMYRTYSEEIPFPLSKNHPGRLLWGDAYYFHDLLAKEETTFFKTPEKLLKLACIADAMNFYDYAMELLVHLTLNYGNSNKNYNFSKVIFESIELLPEELKIKIISLPIGIKLKELEAI